MLCVNPPRRLSSSFLSQAERYRAERQSMRCLMWKPSNTNPSPENLHRNTTAECDRYKPEATRSEFLGNYIFYTHPPHSAIPIRCRNY
ncbi:hypothetical protein XELAEV_18000437mg [Xenopus laevis]|uniref:Uncharacterized protein n=1 Tax=Xenopus laevis TaxID=8355 RepID=A0A974BP50_XENLA|nr:hypothetical protein XELAEV_18000437mg [Xenopus laevis]